MGTVAFLFSDIEGSTRRWLADTEAMQAAVALHDEIVRDVMRRYGGYIFSTAGDSFAVAFPEVSHATAAATEAQRALAQGSWEEVGGLSVRMGVHAGTAQARAGDYFGPELSRTARIMDAAHGGQVLISAAAAAQVGDLPTLDLGEHALRDLPAPERLHQLLIEGLPAEFPPPRSNAQDRNSLPVQHSSFVGRNVEAARLARMIHDHRLVTVTGTGGTGKTRLAIETGGRARELYPDGLFFVDLSSVVDGAQLPTSLAAGIGARIDPAGPVLAQALGHLGPRRALIVIDNCEHLLDATADLVLQVLATCPAVTVLATSREALDVPGEYVLRIPPLASSSEGPGLASAVRLFIDRATAINPDLSVDDAMQEQIAEVCSQLDGIPLAIELAAARCRSMTPGDLLVHIADRFALLAGGSRRSRPRQATMEAAIDWSYTLLSHDEQRALRALSVFGGRFDLDDAVAVLGVGVSASLELLDGLVAKSLLSADVSTTPAKHRLLESIRAYGQLKLAEHGEVSDARDLHLAHFVDRLPPVEDTRSLTVGHVRWMEAHRVDLQLAVDWADAQGRDEELGCLANGMFGLLVTAHDPQGNVVLDRALAGDISDRVRKRLRFTRACTAMVAGDLELWLACTADSFQRPIADSLDALLRYQGAFLSVVADPMTAAASIAGTLKAASDDRSAAIWGHMYQGLMQLVLFQPSEAMAAADEVERLTPPGDELAVLQIHSRMTRLAALLLVDRSSEAAAFADAARLDETGIWGTTYEVLTAVAKSAAGHHREADALLITQARATDATAFPGAADALLAGFGLLALHRGDSGGAQRLLDHASGARTPQLMVLVIDALALLEGEESGDRAAARQVAREKILAAITDSGLAERREGRQPALLAEELVLAESRRAAHR